MMHRFAFAIAVFALFAVTAACGDAYDDDTPSTAAIASPTSGGGGGTPIVATGVSGTAIASTPPAGETPAQGGTPPPPTTAPTPDMPDVGTGIAGIVLIGPQCPVVQAGVPCPDKPFEATIEVYSGGRLVDTVRSGADGVFSVALGAGTYRLVPLSPGGPTMAAEQAVVVRDGATTLVTINYDSGIR